MGAKMQEVKTSDNEIEVVVNARHTGFQDRKVGNKSEQARNRNSDSEVFHSLRGSSFDLCISRKVLSSKDFMYYKRLCRRRSSKLY